MSIKDQIISDIVGPGTHDMQDVQQKLLQRVLESLSIWSGDDAWVAFLVGQKGHVGGLSACIHYGYSSAPADMVSLFVEKDATYLLRKAPDHCKGTPPKIVVTLRAIEDTEDVIPYACGDYLIYGSLPARAVAEAVCEGIDGDILDEIVSSALADGIKPKAMLTEALRFDRQIYDRLTDSLVRTAS